MITTFNETIVALATPPGEGALGIIRLSGGQALAIVDQMARDKNLSTQDSHTLHLAKLYGALGQVLDEAVVSIFKGTRSYTGEEVVEITCHGSSYILQAVIEESIRLGARLAKPGEFTLRAFLNGKMDLSQAEAVADLIAADSEAAHKMAMQQMRGGFSDEIKALRQKLIDFASLIELELDFGEEDVEFADRTELIRLVDQTQVVIRQLSDSFKLGNVLKKGVNTVIAGRPNAGKSTLLNALLNEDRAIVSDIAGTTRDTIEEELNINGILFRLIDTAGIREAQDQIEAIGVEKTMEKIQQSALLVYVFEAPVTRPAEVWSDLEKLVQSEVPYLVVSNKMDRNPYAKAEDYEHELLPKENFIPVSAKNQMNIEYLKERLYQTVIDQGLLGEHVIVTNARHFDALLGAQESLQMVLQGLQAGISGDLVALDIRQALHHLGTITGEVTTDDLLGNIFGRFCIGK